MVTLASQDNLAAGELRLYDDKKLVETWYIQHMWVGGHESGKDNSVVKVNYDHVEYRSSLEPIG